MAPGARRQVFFRVLGGVPARGGPPTRGQPPGVEESGDEELLPAHFPEACQVPCWIPLQMAEIEAQVPGVDKADHSFFSAPVMHQPAKFASKGQEEPGDRVPRVPGMALAQRSLAFAAGQEPRSSKQACKGIKAVVSGGCSRRNLF